MNNTTEAVEAATNEAVIVNQHGEETSLVAPAAGFDFSITDEQVGNLLAKAEKAKVDEGKKLGIDYYEFRKGDNINAVFLGWKIVNPTNKQTGEVLSIPAPVFQTADNRRYLNYSVVFRDCFYGLKEGSVVNIVCKGKKDKTLDYDITLLNID